MKSAVTLCPSNGEQTAPVYSAYPACNTDIAGRRPLGGRLRRDFGLGPPCPLSLSRTSLDRAILAYSSPSSLLRDTVAYGSSLVNNSLRRRQILACNGNEHLKQYSHVVVFYVAHGSRLISKPGLHPFCQSDPRHTLTQTPYLDELPETPSVGDSNHGRH